MTTLDSPSKSRQEYFSLVFLNRNNNPNQPCQTQINLREGGSRGLEFSPQHLPIPQNTSGGLHRAQPEHFLLEPLVFLPWEPPYCRDQNCARVSVSTLHIPDHRRQHPQCEGPLRVNWDWLQWGCQGPLTCGRGPRLQAPSSWQIPPCPVLEPLTGNLSLLQAPAPCRGDVSVGTGPEPCVGVQLEPGIVLATPISASSPSPGAGTALYPPCRSVRMLQSSTSLDCCP